MSRISTYHPLTYRLTMPEGGSIGMSTEDPELGAQLRQRAADLVYDAFEAGTCPVVDRTLDRTPEILSAATLEHIDELEYALNDARNFLLDQPETPLVRRLLAAADEALEGYL
jgi:hypothetical protein